MTGPTSPAETAAYPAEWVTAAAAAAHLVLDEVDDGWHYACTADPSDQSCGKGFEARRMLVDDVMPAVLAALDQIGALKPSGSHPVPCR